MKISITLAWVLLAVAVLAGPNEREIRSKSILLPISQAATDHKVEYVTEAYGGCYHWSANEPDVLSVQGIVTDNCESKAIVRLNHQGAFLSPLSISAKDKGSDEVVKAFVRLAKISSIDIVTKFRVMNVNQVVEFYITAYDAEHNTFSSLKGFKFQWSIIQDSSIVERVSLKDSGIHQETSYRRDLEALGYQTDMFVLRALKIGQLRLRAKLKEPRYEGIEAEIRVSVQERFDIEPASPVYLLAKSKFKFNLLNSKFEQIKLPNAVYKQTLSNQAYLLSPTLQITTPSADSQTLLVVQDDRTTPAYKNEVQIYSYAPDEMQIRTKEYIVAGQQEIYAVEFYRNKRLLRGIVDYEIWSSELTLKKDRLTLIGRDKTVGVIRAKYGTLSAEKTVVVNLPVRAILMQDRVVLPVGQTFQLNVVGGTQEYRYQIQPSSLADITLTGLITSKSKGAGVITVTDRKDPKNTIQIQLSVEPVRSVRSLEQRMQVPLNDESQIITIAEPQTSKAFTQCNDLPINLDHTINNNIKQAKINREYLSIVNQLRNEANLNSELRQLLSKTGAGKIDFDAIKEFGGYVQAGEISSERVNNIVNSLNNYGICLGLKIVGINVRDNPAKLLFNHTSGPEFVTRVFQPLRTLDIDPKVFDIIMTPQSSFNWKAKGGPTQWQSEPIAYINNQRAKDRSALWIECGNNIQTINYQLSIVNTATQKLPRPAVSTANLTIHCKYPSSIRLEAPNTNLDKKYLYLTKSEPFLLDVVGYDQLGRKFSNNSNLDYTWDISGTKRLAQPKPSFKFEIIPGASKHLIKVSSNHIEKNSMLSFPTVSDEMQLLMKSPFSLSSNNRVIDEVTLILHPFNKQIVSIREGSGTFGVLCISEVVKCSYTEFDHKVEIVPVKVGEAIVKISDIMVYGREDRVIKVYVVDPQRMVLKSNSTMIEQGRYVRIEALVYGQGDREVDSSQFRYFNSKITTDCISKEVDRTPNSVVYQLTQKGSCSVYGYIDGISKPGEVLTSLLAENTLKLQVYKRFAANLLDLKQTIVKGIAYHDANMNLALGCNSFLTFVGGPEHKLDIKYSCKPDGIVVVNHLDDRNYQFKSVAEGSTNFKLTLLENGVEISETNIKILVKRITGIEIVGLVNGKREVHKGATVRLVPKIMIGDDYKVADSFCPLNYDWRTSDADIIRIGEWSTNDERYMNSGLNITALNKGTAIIELAVMLQGSTKEIAKTKALVKVLELTDVHVPTYIGEQDLPSSYLLIPPHSGYSFPSDYRIRVLSPCDRSIEVKQNQLETFEEKKPVGIQLTSINSDETLNYLTIVISKIHSVIIDNPSGLLNLQVNSRVRVRFFVQDSFGRLFPNNLANVQYVAKVSNPHILSAEISEDNEVIELRAINNGSCQLILSVSDTEAYDIVPVRVGNLITPNSPVYVHEGGYVNFQSQEGKGDWLSSTPSVLSIDMATGEALAQKEGTAEVTYKTGVSFRSKVNVFQVTNIVKNEPAIELDYATIKDANLTYSLIWRSPGPVELTHDLNAPNNPINHNLIFRCESKNPDWFETVGDFIQFANNTQVPVCLVRTRKTQPQSKIPQSLVITTTLLSNRSSFKLSQVFSYPFHFEFSIPERDKAIDMNPDYCIHNVTIKTNEELVVDTRDWLSSHYSHELRQQTIRIDLQDHRDYLKTAIKVRNPATGQADTIGLRFDPKGRGQPSESTWFKRSIRWTDYIIALMIVVMILLFANSRVDNDRPKTL